jgi:hypothetical protein
MAAALGESALQRLMIITIQRWWSLVQRRNTVDFMAGHATALARKANERIRFEYYAAWKTFVKVHQRRSASQKKLALLVIHTSTVLVATCFGKWKRFTEMRVRDNLLQAHTDRLPEVAELRDKLQAVQHLLQRRWLLDDATEAIRMALAARSEKLARIEELQRQNAEIEGQIEAKRQGKVDAVTRSIQEQVADLIARLKCKILNFNGDFGLIGKIVERSKRLGAAKSFLEAHAAVKRVVVELVQITYLDPDVEWPLSGATITRMRSHHTETVLGAIKSMIITYDIMTPEERHSLQTDHEIVVNARILQEIADFCIRSKNKRQGGRR